MSNSLRPHEPQHASHPCPLPTPGVYSNSCSLSQWCHPTISSFIVLFSSCLQSFPASGSFQMSQFFASGGQSIGVSASASVHPMNIQDWFPLGWIFLQSKGLSRVFSSTTVVSPYLNLITYPNTQGWGRAGGVTDTTVCCQWVCRWHSPNPYLELVKFKYHREDLGAQSHVFPVNKQPSGKDVKQPDHQATQNNHLSGGGRGGWGLSPMTLKTVPRKEIRLRKRREFTKTQVSSSPLANGRGWEAPACVPMLYSGLGLHGQQTGPNLGNPSWVWKGLAPESHVPLCRDWPHSEPPSPSLHGGVPGHSPGEGSDLEDQGIREPPCDSAPAAYWE